jgi:hypothetical protein
LGWWFFFFLVGEGDGDAVAALTEGAGLTWLVTV